MVNLSVLGALSTLVVTGFSICTSPTVRRDWRSLSEVERSDFITAQQTLWRQGIDPSTGFSVYDTNFTIVHRDNTPIAHQVPAFLPWHRRFLRDYEAALRTVNPNVSLPYWNWGADNGRLNQSIVFDDKYFGGNGVGDDFCVQDGRYANWTLNIGGNFSDVHSNVDHCLRRLWKYGINHIPLENYPVVPSTDQIASNITSFNASFAAFRSWFEPHHGTIHLGVGGSFLTIGGDMTAVENSPNDPIFWLHHSFIDRTWWQLQQGSAAAKNSYGGFPNPRAELPENDPIWTRGARSTDILQPWGVTVESAMFTDADDYCYTYE